MFEFVERMFRKKEHHKRPEDHHRERRRQSLEAITKELEAIEKNLTEKNSAEASKQFYTLVKKAFRESLDLKYSATFQEIKKETKAHAHYNAELKEELAQFIDDLAVMEYGYPEFKAIMEEERYEREKQLHDYIRDLESQGDKIKVETKKRINEIVSESIPHTDKELLAKTMARFKNYLAKLF